MKLKTWIQQAIQDDRVVEDPDEPRFGYGAHHRPLWSRRDYAAEQIRRVLCDAGYTECRDTPQGFVVEGANSSKNGDEPFRVTDVSDDPVVRSQRVGAWEQALRTEGWQVTTDDTDENVLLVHVDRTQAAPARYLRKRPPIWFGAVLWIGLIAAVTGWFTGQAVLEVGGLALVIAGFCLGVWHDRVAERTEPSRSIRRLWRRSRTIPLGHTRTDPTANRVFRSYRWRGWRILDVAEPVADTHITYTYLVGTRMAPLPPPLLKFTSAIWDGADPTLSKATQRNIRDIADSTGAIHTPVEEAVELCAQFDRAAASDTPFPGPT